MENRELEPARFVFEAMERGNRTGCHDWIKLVDNVEAYAAQEVAKATAELVAASQLVIDGIKYSEASPTYKGNMAFVETSTGEWTEFQNAVKALEDLLHHKVKS